MALMNSQRFLQFHPMVMFMVVAYVNSCFIINRQNLFSCFLKTDLEHKFLSLQQNISPYSYCRKPVVVERISADGKPAHGRTSI
jgi:hypothetical protein